MAAEYGSRAGFGNFSFNGVVYCVCLAGGGNNAEYCLGCYKGGDGKCHGVGRNQVDRRKASVVNLLHTAYVIQFHGLYRIFIVEIRYVRVIKSNMSVFADTHTDDIAGVLCKQCGISFRFRIRVGCGNINIIYGSKGHLAENGVI